MSLTEPPPLQARSPIEQWALDPHVIHCNHGSFGGCLRSVIDAANAVRTRLESAPMRFFGLAWQGELDRARARLAHFVAADPERTVFVPNATTGVASALAAVPLTTGDEIVITDHTYRACANQIARRAGERGARIVTVPIALPFDADQFVSAIAAAITPRTKLVVLDHVTSPSALVLPIERVVPTLAARSITTIIDGAHGPGQVEVDVATIGADFYVGNCHKWMCAPKASGFIAARDASKLTPLITSHGASDDYGPPNRLHAQFDWTGTYDPAAQLAVPAAIEAVATCGGGWPAVRARNHAFAIEMRGRLLDALGGTALAPTSAIGAMAAIPIALPAGLDSDTLERALLVDGWEVKIAPTAGGVVRISAHLYNEAADADAVARELVRRGVRGRKL